MEKQQKVYYLAPEREYYSYILEYSTKVGYIFPKGMYCKAYSRAQARVYFCRRLAEMSYARFYDIDIDINDIEER